VSALGAVVLAGCSETPRDRLRAREPGPCRHPRRGRGHDRGPARRREVDIRLIGIDTPESVAPGQSIECYGRRASAYTESRLEGEIVRLEFDVERLDRYGRTLAYVWVDDELFNETLVAEGYAVVTTFPPNVTYVDRFLAAQRAAGRPAGPVGECS